MNILRLFGIGSKAILEKGRCVKGTVTRVSRCWWLTVNTKPARRFSGDGAVYPSIITFEYQADNVPCNGKLYIPIRYRVPQAGETIDVFYDPENRKTMHAMRLGRGLTDKKITERTIC